MQTSETPTKRVALNACYKSDAKSKMTAKFGSYTKAALVGCDYFFSHYQGFITSNTQNEIVYSA